MAHICPNCFEYAPLLFDKCPECKFDISQCNVQDCDHTYTTRNRMMRDKKRGLDISKIKYYTIHSPGRDAGKLLRNLMDELADSDETSMEGIIDDIECDIEGATHYIENHADLEKVEDFLAKMYLLRSLVEQHSYSLARKEVSGVTKLFNGKSIQKVINNLKDVT